MPRVYEVITSILLVREERLLLRHDSHYHGHLDRQGSMGDGEVGAVGSGRKGMLAT